MNYYSGIGSRETPPDILEFMTYLGEQLSNLGYTLRSGHATGADQAFEKGCDIAKGPKEIYIPWYNFQDSYSNLILSNPETFKIAKQFHPVWDKLTDGAKKLHARNVHQVLGLDLQTKSDVVICWTQNGEDVGGTAMAIKIARHYNVPIINIGSFPTIRDAHAEIQLFLEGIAFKGIET